MHKSWSVHTRCQAMLDAGSAVGFFFLRNNSLKRDVLGFYFLVRLGRVCAGMRASDVLSDWEGH